MELSISEAGTPVLVKVSGIVDRNASGHLYDALIQAIGGDRTSLIVDLTDVTLMTRAGVRGLVVAAKLLQTSGGAMRICGARRNIRLMLSGLGFDNLLKLDPTIEASVAALAQLGRIGGDILAARHGVAVLHVDASAEVPSRGLRLVAGGAR